MSTTYTFGHDGEVLAHCPYCTWADIYPDWHEALIGGLRHGSSCERA